MKALAVALSLAALWTANVNSEPLSTSKLTPQSSGLNKPENALQLEDIFTLEYASNINITKDAKQVYFVRNYMDINTDRKLTNIWQVSKQGQLTPVTTGLKNDFAPSLSPSNDRLAYLSDETGSVQIHMKWLESGQTARISNLSSMPSKVVWSPDEKYLAFTQFVAEKTQPVVNLPGKPAKADWAKPAVFVDSMYYRFDGVGNLNNGYQQIFIMSADGGSPRQVTFAKSNHNGAISWSKDSKTLLYAVNELDESKQEWTNSNIFALELNSGEPKQLTDELGTTSSPIVSPNGKYIAYLNAKQNYRNYQNVELMVMNLDGSEQRSLTKNLDRSINSIKWSSNSKGVYMMYHDHGETFVDHQALSGKRKRMAKNLGGLSFGRPYTGAQFDVSENGTLAYTFSDPQRPADVAITRKGKTEQLTDLNADALDHKQLASIKEITVKSSYDQRPIQAWIALPPNYEALKNQGKKLPLILEIHGGPVTNYGPHFAAEIQLMAAQGYVVVYANPRGSDSYGKEFAQTIYNNYPSQDYDDLMSVVDGVIATEAVDTDKLYVTGGSGGGVLTSWIIGHTDRFKAAVVAKPVINWISFTLTTDIHSFVIKNWFEKMPWEDPEHYMKLSPLSYVGNVTTPTMLLTGEADLRTPIGETEQYYQALKLRNIPTAMVRIPDAPHGIYKRPSNLMSKVAHILWWFEQHP
ncbi:S9 family peptidase [Shewanella maritima]|uniref:S9 family peptidase n=1 Tax=Shewanella maritima TaxID=2520507 RepID=A0A411PLA4_9GAMM|nr:S9 family peptidase [Shewanella maritima]QBF84333.1 S9 family peptidase [Shewanella maritima]